MTEDIKSKNRPFVARPLFREAFALFYRLMICACILTASLPGVNAVCGESSENTADASLSADQLKYRLRKDRISSPARRRNGKTAELKMLIEQVRSIQFEPAGPRQPAQQPGETESATSLEPTAVADNDTETKSEPPAKSMVARTLQKVEKLMKDPNAIANPLGLAEVLFRSGRPDLAGVCYKQALASIPGDDPNMADDRAWILFQIGNCFKHTDPNESRQSYAELIRTYPDSPWTEAAKVGHGLVEWHQRQHPQKLIREFGR